MQRLIVQSTRSYASVSPLAITRKGLQPLLAPPAVKAVSKTQSGVHIATYDNKGPASSLAVVLQLGSRNDPKDTPGAAHFLKSVLVRNLPGDTIVRTVREAELRGNTLYTTVDREHLVIGAEFLRDDLVDVAPLLLSHLFNPSFEPYEFLDAIPSVVLESQTHLSNPSTLNWELAHNLAFRTGLGSPLFVSKSNSGNLTRKKLMDLLKSVSPSQIAIIGTGINHDELVELVRPQFDKYTSTATVPTATTQYFGGEFRFDVGVNSKANYLVALKSVGYSSQLYPASLILEQLLGGTTVTPYGNPTGLLGSCSTQNTTVKAELKSYSDAGLLGLVITGSTKDVKNVAASALSVLKKVADGGINETEVKKAVKKVIVRMEQGREAEVERMKKVLNKGGFESTEEVKNGLEKVSVADVIKVAKEAVSAKLSVVANGNTAELPYADELSV